MTGQPLDIVSSDATLHNVHAAAKANTAFNLGMPAPGTRYTRTFDRPEIVPFKCDVHPWMRAWVAVVPHPFFAVTGADGRYEIRGLPAGHVHGRGVAREAPRADVHRQRHGRRGEDPRRDLRLLSRRPARMRPDEMPPLHTPKPVRVATRAVAASVFLLLVAGALVTSTGSGLAVPDWPLSYGKLMPPMVGGILYEHGHRLIAATVATMVGLQILLLGFGRADRTTFRLSLAAFGAILGQAVLGGLTVLFLLPPAVSSAHAGLAQIVFALTSTIALRTSLFWDRFTEEAPRATADSAALAKAFRLALWAAGGSYVQILLGAIVRHTGAGLAIPDWPLSFGKVVPTGAEWAVKGVLAHFTHRTFAWVVVALVVAAALALRKLRGVPGLGALSTLWLVLLAAQVTLGATSVWTAKAVPVTAAHLAVGGLLWIAGVLAAVLLARLRSLTTVPATAAAPSGETAPVPA